ncbi:MAG: hypothetical protein JSS04_19045 [Proteobacteria bacterium]|nr:hypothetical protein [Pseudomonadota bacterium]
MVALLEALTAVGAVALAGAARRATLSLAGLTLCAMLFVVSLAFFTLAGYRALEQTVGAIHAPLAIGGVYLVLALVALLAVQSRR